MRKILCGVVTIGMLLGGLISPAFSGDDRTRLKCDADGVGDTSMDARFETRSEREKFDASFEARAGGVFMAGDLLAVSVGSVPVGTIELVEVFGDVVGDLEFDSRDDEGNPFPADFPEVNEGTSVVVGSLGCDLDD